MMKDSRRAVCSALLAAAFYALSAPCAKLLLADVGSTMLAGLLYLGAGLGVGLLLLVRRMGGKPPVFGRFTRADGPFLAGMVALDIAAPILLLAGLRTAGAETVSLLNNFEIVATALIARFAFREPISARLWAGIGLITAACLALARGEGGGLTPSLGALLVLLACACWGLENNCTRRLSGHDPRAVVVVKGFGSGLGALGIALALGERLPGLRTLGPALLLGFVAYGLSITCYIAAQRTLGAARTSAYYAAAPFLGAGLSLVLFRTPLSPLFLAALGLMLAGAWLAAPTEGRGHRHGGVHSIDAYAYASRLRVWNPAFKLLFSLGTLVLCIAADNLWVSLFLLAAMAALTVGRGGLDGRAYLGLLAVPLAFLCISGLTIAVGIGAGPNGDWNLHLGAIWLYTGRAALLRAVNLSFRALGAVSAMYFLTLTTPACEIVGVLRRARLPGLLTELMYLIYRFIFILLDTQGRMQQAAESRLGTRDFRTACRAFAGMAGNLLITAMRRSGAYYDAMAARCYQGGIAFLEEDRPLTLRPCLLAGGIWLAAALLWAATA